MDASQNFVNGIDTNKHILLLYNDPQYAKTIEFLFIKNGLVKGEHCIYATQEDPSFIKTKMEEHGIDVKNFLKKGLLHIYRPSDPFSNPDGVLEGAKTSLDLMLKDSTSPYRMITMLIPDTEIAEVIDIHIKIEKEFHANFENFNGSMMCPYNLKNLEQNDSRDRVQELVNSHHSVIYAQPSEKC